MFVARSLEVSETVIGLTLVAIGTSLPELATTIMAALRRQSEVALGNVIGSNIFNITAIIGAATLFAPIEVPDEIYYRDGAMVRDTDRAGGTEGGMSIGGVLRVRAAMKPISTVMRPLRTVDVATKEPDVAFRERSDVCAVPRAGVVAEQVVAITLADDALRMFGGDTVDDVVAAVERYRARVGAF